VIKGLTGLSRSKILSMFRLIPLLSVFQELFLVYPWLVWFGTWLNFSVLPPHMNLISYIILTVFTEVFAHIAQERGWSAKRMQFIVFPSTIVLWLILFRLSVGGGYGLLDTGWFGYLNDNPFPAVIALLSGPYFIWRGISVSRQSNLFEDLYHKFIIGLVFVVALLVFWAVSIHQSSGIWSTLGIYGLAYFGLGLVVLALANLDSLSRVFARHQETVSAFRRRWSSMLLVIIVIILGISIALASIFSTNVAATLTSALSHLGEWILIGITYLFWPAAFVAAALYYIGQWIISLITGGKAPEQLEMKLPDFARQVQGEEVQGSHLSPILVNTLKWSAVALVIILAVFLIWRFLSNYWRDKAEEGVEEENESLWSWSVFKGDLLNFLVWLFPWLRRRKKAQQESSASYVPEYPEIVEDRELSIREMYRGVLRRGRLLGLPRNKSETAYEYTRRLQKKREAAAEELDQLTEAYVVERYGDKPAGPEKTTFFNRLWKTLSSKLLRSDSDEPR
jgi:hypothetical protein